VIFSAIGDVPYGADEIPELEQHVADHNLYSPSAFLVHLGDIQSSSEPCQESRYQTVADVFLASEVPVFIVPGDNEWVGCSDPAQGWAWWEAHLLGLEESFCNVWSVAAQATRPENFSFVRDGVLFLGLNNVSGGPSDVEQESADWVDAQFAAHGASARAAVLMAQKEPGGDLFDAVKARGRAFARPVLYIHGNGHDWLEDPSYFGEPNMLRVQVDRGSASHPPVQVTVTAAGLFLFDRDPWPPGTPEVSRLPCGPPTADFSAAPVSGAAPLAVSFTDLSAGAPTSWLWTFGDGATSTAQHPTHTYTSPGVYDVTLRASNVLGSSTKLRAGLVGVVPPPPSQTFLPTADAYVKSSSPTSNYGTSSELRVKTSDSTYRSYLRFDVSSLANPWVISARLRLFVTDGSADGGALYPVATGWTESGLTWATAPSIGGAPIAGGAAVTAGQWREIDVTSWVRGTGTYDFGLASGSSSSAYYSSRQGANPPQLVIQSLPAAVPVADFAGTPTSGTAPLSVQFTDLSSGGPTSWLWTFGDGTTSTLRSPSKTYATAGTYTVSLRATNSLGSDTYTRSGYVQVANPLPPVANFSGTPLSGFAPLQVAFTDLSTNGPTSWLWSFGDGTTSTLRNPSKTYTSPGVYSVSLRATNVSGSNTLVRSGYVNAASGKIFAVAADARTSSGSPTRNYGSSSELRAGSSSTAYQSYLRFDLGGLAGLGVVQARLRLFVTGSSVSGGSVYRTSSSWTESGITWANAPAPSGGALSSAGPASTGQWVEFDVTSAVSGDGSVAFALTNASTDRVDYSSREGANPAQLHVWTGPPVAPVANFGATPRSGPAPLSVAFEDLSSGGPTSWSWSFGDGATSTLRNPVHQYTSAGTRDVRLTVSNSAGTNSLLRVGYVQVSAPLPITTFTASADAKTSLSNPAVNYGAAPDLRVRGGTSDWRSFLRFDVAGLTQPVVRATLRLYVDDGSDDGGAVSAVSSAWSEGAITWNTAPPLGTTLANVGVAVTGTWVEVDVTSAVTGNGSYAFGIGKTVSNSVYYASRESAHAPQLVIETTP
jgi:PKD repeat protein